MDFYSALIIIDTLPYKIPHCHLKLQDCDENTNKKKTLKQTTVIHEFSRRIKRF